MLHHRRRAFDCQGGCHQLEGVEGHRRAAGPEGPLGGVGLVSQEDQQEAHVLFRRIPYSEGKRWISDELSLH